MKLIKPLLLVFCVGCLTAPAHALEIKKVVSPKGIEAWLVENHALPIIALSAAWERPISPKIKTGAVAMMAAMLDEGAADMNWENFRAKLEDRSINMRFDAGHDAVYGEMRTLSENKDTAFRLLREAITRPRFDRAPIEKIRAQLLTLAAQRNQSLQSFAKTQWYRAAFGNHPYAFPVEGLAKDLRAISKKNLRHQHKKILTQKNLSIVAVGDITVDDLAQALDQIFGSLPKGEKIKKSKAKKIKWRARKIFIKHQSPQTAIYFGLPGLTRDDPDFIAYYVMNHVLGGGGLTSRLAVEAREKRGLVYSIGTSALALRAAGFILGAAATRNNRAQITQSLIIKILARFRKKGVSTKALADAKAYLIGSYGLNFDSSVAIARNLTYIKRHRLGIDYVEKRNALIMNVTQKDIARLTQKFLQPEKMIMMVVGGDQNSRSKNKSRARN